MCDQFGARSGSKLVEILLSPSDRWQLCRTGYVQQLPVRFPALEGNQEPAMRLRHFSDNEINQGFSRNLKLIEMR